MKFIDKSIKMEGISYDVRGPVLEAAEKLRSQGINILSLNTGNPAEFGFEAPDEIIQDLVYHVRESEGYSDSKGIFSARKAIVQYCQRKGFPEVSIDDIYTGNGVSELIMMSMMGLINSGDEILVPMPDYPLWTASVSLAGGTPVHYVCDEASEWYPDLEDIRRKITHHTKAIVLINPNNPTGALYSKTLLEDIAEIAREHQLIIFSDEIYDRLVFDQEVHHSIAALAPDLSVITFNGLSKSHLVAGFRCGWMVISGNRQAIKGYIEGLNMLASMRLCSNVLSQHIIQTGLGGEQAIDPMLLPGGRIYEQREFVMRALSEIPGVSAVKPKAAFYVFPKLDQQRFNLYDDEQFVLDFLHEHHILLVHGRGFHWHQPDHFRLIYLPEIDVLENTMDALKEFLSHYHQR